MQWPIRGCFSAQQRSGCEARSASDSKSAFARVADERTCDDLRNKRRKACVVRHLDLPGQSPRKSVNLRTA